MADLQDVHNINGTDAYQAAVFVIDVFSEVKFEECGDLGYLGYWIVQGSDHLFC